MSLRISLSVDKLVAFSICYRLSTAKASAACTRAQPWNPSSAHWLRALRESS